MLLNELESVMNRAIDRLGVDKDAELAREVMKGIIEAIDTLHYYTEFDGGKFAMAVMSRELERQNVWMYNDGDKLYFGWIAGDDDE